MRVTKIEFSIIDGKIVGDDAARALDRSFTGNGMGHADQQNMIVGQLSEPEHNGRVSSQLARQKTVGKRKVTGQGITEYVIIVALIAIASIAAVSFFGNAVQSSFGGLASVLGGGTADQGRAGATTAAQGAVAEGQKKRSLKDYDK